jgi:hypothetical protein
VNPVPGSSTVATDDQIHDLVNLLLDQAVVVSYAVSQLHTLASTHADGEPAAHADVGQAITAMTAVRAQLVGSADHLTQLLERPYRGG